MAHLYAHFDESGTHGEHGIISFSGFVDHSDAWRAFQVKWHGWLTHYGIQEFHTVKALRHSQPYGKMLPGTPEERTKDVLPFVNTIVLGISLGIAILVDVNDYKAAHPAFRNTFGDDPHYFAFARAVERILHFQLFPRHYEVGLILDDEEKKAMECYRLLKKMKLKHKEVRDRVTSICFSSDRGSIPVQASDLFAYLMRQEAEYRFHGKPYPYRTLVDAFQQPSPETGIGMFLGADFYDAEMLKRYMAAAKAQRKKLEG